MGRAATWTMLAFVSWFVLNQTILGFVQQQPDVLPRTLLIIQGILGLGLGALAGVLALIAIVRRHDRSVLVFVAALPLAFVVFFLAGELLVPH